MNTPPFLLIDTPIFFPCEADPNFTASVGVLVGIAVPVVAETLLVTFGPVSSIPAVVAVLIATLVELVATSGVSPDIEKDPVYVLPLSPPGPLSFSC
jgi:hypothetical protein